MRLSVVTTMYRSAPYLVEFHERVCRTAERLFESFEIVFVNDGSPDDSLEVALELYERDPRVRVVDLSRNFGHHKAIMTGLAHARGELVFLIDCDLEEAPELLEAFYERMRTEKADVVYGVQASRKGSIFERLTGAVYYWIFNAISPVPLPRNLVTVRLMSGRYVRALVAHREREILIAGLWAITGFAQAPFEIVKLHKGSTTYNLSRKVSNLVNSVTSFSNQPLVFIFYLGCTIILLSGLAGLYLVVRRLFFGVYLAGWASLIVSVWFLGGLTIFSLGVIGIYLSKVFTETKQRPYTIVRELYDHRAEVESGSREISEPAYER
jgi:putative glycosyltransferase